MLGQYFYLPVWYVKNCILRQHHPLQTVLFITDYCNLKCKHCTEAGHACTTMKPYEQIREELEYSYRLGSRFIDFEGGEPTLWTDGTHTLNDLYELAKEIGFYSCTLTTNAQRPFGDTKADQVWVSVDGYREVHDEIRRPGAFEALDRNIRESGHPNVSINMAINVVNKDSVFDTIQYAKDNPCIRSISLNFHTPYAGTEHMMLPWDERCRIIDRIIALKKQGYPIMNSVSGLKTMKRRGFEKYCWISNFILNDGTRLDTCAGKMVGVCDDCGFGMAGEMYCVMHLKPDTLLAGVDLRVRKKS